MYDVIIRMVYEYVYIYTYGTHILSINYNIYIYMHNKTVECLFIDNEIMVCISLYT